MSVLHKGTQEKCVVCNPEVKRERERRKPVRGPKTLENYIRRQVAEEIGENEPRKEERFAVLQKYGVTAPRIDRKVSKPDWMGGKEWNQKQHQWFVSTKGLVPAKEGLRRGPQSRFQQQNKPYRPQPKRFQPVSRQRP